MIENNPVSLLLSQYYQLYPRNGICQYLLNIGSGSKSEKPDQTQGHNDIGAAGSVINAYRSSAARRIVLAYEWLLSGLSYWERFTRSSNIASELQERCIRLDVSLGSIEPRLDDVSAIPKLKEKVRNDKLLATSLNSMADRIIACMFYFELEERPTQLGPVCNGLGRILCKRKCGDPALSLLIEKLVSCNARFIVNGQVMGGNMLASHFWDQMGNFLMPTQFQVVGQHLSISLSWPDGRIYPISGSLYHIPTVVKAQGLNAYFGLPDHRRWHRAPRQIQHIPLDRDCEDTNPGTKRALSRNALVSDDCKRRRLKW